jgi:hypothetical protein
MMTPELFLFVEELKRAICLANRIPLEFVMSHPYRTSKYKSNWKTYYRILKNIPGQPERVIFHTPVKADFETEFKRLVFEWKEKEYEHPTTRHHKADPLERKPHAR